MNERSKLQAFVAFLSMIAAGACSSQATPAPGARAPTATASTPASSTSAMPVLTPTGVVSALPPPAPPPSTPRATPGARLSPDGKLCGGIAGFQCPDKHYCSFETDARCGAGDMAGTCKPIPDLCTMEFAPVCGCDGKTYSTACVAGRSAISVASKGACSGDSVPAIAPREPAKVSPP